jgi:MarR family transcriptional regulator, 2-MHQ and catechol-resistance regulon repressor
VPQDRRETFYRERVHQCGPRYSGFDLPSAEAALNLIHTYDLFHQVTARYMAGYGLSKSTLNVLMLLRHGNPEGMLLHDLGELLLVSRANITGLIDHLEEKGLVKRVVDDQDRRARFARITRPGEQVLDRLMPVHFRNVAKLFSELDDDEKFQLTGLLRKARASMVTHAAEAAATESKVVNE